MAHCQTIDPALSPTVYQTYKLTQAEQILCKWLIWVRPEGLEPSTPCLEGNAHTHFQSPTVFGINGHSKTYVNMWRILGG